jgi:hypothetical protein
VEEQEASKVKTWDTYIRNRDPILSRRKHGVKRDEMYLLCRFVCLRIAVLVAVSTKLKTRQHIRGTITPTSIEVSQRDWTRLTAFHH